MLKFYQVLILAIGILAIRISLWLFEIAKLGVAARQTRAGSVYDLTVLHHRLIVDRVMWWGIVELFLIVGTTFVDPHKPNSTWLYIHEGFALLFALLFVLIRFFKFDGEHSKHHAVFVYGALFSYIVALVIGVPMYVTICR